MTEPNHRLRRYAEEIASSVSPARSRVAAMRAIGQAQRTPQPRRVPRIAFATLTVFLALNVVTAGVANAAVPGDLLYPVDRGYESALEMVGLGGDRSEERVSEAEDLVARDDVAGAADLVAEAVDRQPVQEAVASLRDADPSDPGFSDTVETLVISARNLVAARQDGEPTSMAEARAAVDLAAIQVSEVARTTAPGPPTHAGDPDPPEHARNDETPADTRPDRGVPPDDPGGTEYSGSPGRPDGQPLPPDDPPGDSGQGEPQGPPEEPPGPSDRGNGKP